MQPLFLAGLFVLGAAVGVFLTTCAERLPFDEAIEDEEDPPQWYYRLPLFGLFLAMPLYTRFRSLLPGARCPACGHRLRFVEKLPLVSFLVQAGRCRSCGFKIPGRHPVVELATGLLFVAFGARFGLSPELVVGLLFTSLFVVATVVDLRFQIIPDEVNLVGLLAGLAWTGGASTLFAAQSLWELHGRGADLRAALPGVLEQSFLLREGSLGWGLSGFLAGAGSLLLLYYVGTAIARTEAMGGGDVKLAGFIGLFLGPKGVLVALFWSTLLGAAFGVLILVLGMGIREGGFTKFAFGPYICLGALATLFFGVDGMVDLYLTFNGALMGLILGATTGGSEGFSGF